MWESCTKHTAVTGAKGEKEGKVHSPLLANAPRQAGFHNSTSMKVIDEDEELLFAGIKPNQCALIPGPKVTRETDLKTQLSEEPL